MKGRKRLALASCAAVLLAVLLAPAATRAGDEVPLKATVLTTSETFVPGIFPVLGTVYSTGEGTSTHLGKLTTSGQVTLTWTPLGIRIDGSATTVAANGDRLYNTVSAWSTGPGDSEGTFVITGGTGRFEGATGSGTVITFLNEDDVQVGIYEGTIDFKNK